MGSCSHFATCAWHFVCSSSFFYSLYGLSLEYILNCLWQFLINIQTLRLPSSFIFWKFCLPLSYFFLILAQYSILSRSLLLTNTLIYFNLSIRLSPCIHRPTTTLSLFIYVFHLKYFSSLMYISPIIFKSSLGRTCK